MPYQILFDKDYKLPNLLILLVLNLSLSSLIAYWLTLPQLITISGIIFTMFLIQFCTKLRLNRNLMNGLLLMGIWGVGVLAWGAWKWGRPQRYGGQEQAEIYGIQVTQGLKWSGIVFGWMASAIILGRYAYGYLQIVEQQKKQKSE